MKRDRLQTVLELRDLVERQRLAERATAQREVVAAEHELEHARTSRAGAVATPGTSLVPAELAAHRLGGIAHGDAVETAADRLRLATRQTEAAAKRVVTAAVDRRSVERLRERRRAVTDRAGERHAARRMDEVALQVWRLRP